jgi:hypothetical protein
VTPPANALREPPTFAPPTEPETAPTHVPANDAEPDFQQLLAVDRKVEWRIFWGEVISLACIAAMAIWALFAARPGG